MWEGATCINQVNLVMSPLKLGSDVKRSMHKKHKLRVRSESFLPLA